MSIRSVGNADIDVRWMAAMTGIGRAMGSETRSRFVPEPAQKTTATATSPKSARAGSGCQSGHASKRDCQVAQGVLLPDRLNGDGWIDLVVANDTAAISFLNQPGTLRKQVRSRPSLRRNGNTGARWESTPLLRNDTDLAVNIGNFANEMSDADVRQRSKAALEDMAIGRALGAATRQT